MSEEIFATYRHSGRWQPLGPLLAVIIALLLAIPLGFLYAYAIAWIPFIFINFIATAGFGLIFGVVAGSSMSRGKVRNLGVAFVSGLLAAAIGLYGAWIGHLHYLGAGFVFLPHEMWPLILELSGKGSWGLSESGNVTGIVLWLVWLIEALIVLGLGGFLSVAMIRNVPFCEENQCWLEDTKQIDTLQAVSRGPDLAALRRGDLSPLAAARPKRADATKWLRLVLKSSPKTEMRVLRLVAVRLEKNKEGKLEEKTEDITGDLLVPREMYELVERFEQLEPAAGPTSGEDEGSDQGLG